MNQHDALFDCEMSRVIFEYASRVMNEIIALREKSNDVIVLFRSSKFNNRFVELRDITIYDTCICETRDMCVVQYLIHGTSTHDNRTSYAFTYDIDAMRKYIESNFIVINKNKQIKLKSL